MRAVRRRGTRAELAVRRWCRGQSLRYRLNVRGLPGSPDLANRRRRWAVFVHGCFWHGHDGCARATIPKRNVEFWIAKIAANQARDASKADALTAAGFRVTTVWECEALALERGASPPMALLQLLDIDGAATPP